MSSRRNRNTGDLGGFVPKEAVKEQVDLKRIPKGIKREFFPNGHDDKRAFLFHIAKINSQDFNNMNKKQRKRFLGFLSNCQGDLNFISGIITASLQ